MVRKLLRASSLGVCIFFAPSSQGWGCQTVHDPWSLVQLQSAFQQGQQFLGFFQEHLDQLKSLDKVLSGNLVPDEIRSCLDQFSAGSKDFSGLFASISSNSGETLRDLNGVAHKYAGTSSISRHLDAKDYFTKRFFPEKTKTNTSDAIYKAREKRMQSAKTTTIESLALARQQKDVLEKGNKNLENLSKQASQHSSVQYQANVQTKFLEQIAQRLDKLIWLQSQMLEMMAMEHVQNQPMVFSGTNVQQNQEK